MARRRVRLSEKTQGLKIRFDLEPEKTYDLVREVDSSGAVVAQYVKGGPWYAGDHVKAGLYEVVEDGKSSETSGADVEQGDRQGSSGIAEDSLAESNGHPGNHSGILKDPTTEAEGTEAQADGEGTASDSDKPTG